MLLFLLAAIGPALLMLWYVYSKDTNPEPTSLLFKGFCFGGLSALLSTLISEPLLNMGFYTSNPTNIVESFKIAFFGAAIPEETAKLFMLWLLLRHCKEFDESYDGIVYAAAVGLGFAAFENVLYLVGAGKELCLQSRAISDSQLPWDITIPLITSKDPERRKERKSKSGSFLCFCTESMTLSVS